MDNKHKCKLLLLYGSQTGTAQYAAEDLGRELERFNFSYEIGPIDGFDPEYLQKQEYAIFVVATTGYGEPPSNMKKFWNLIMAKDCSLKLNGLKYTIFGLGDSSYDRFNWVAKLLNNRLKMMGSELFHPVALGDDQHDFGYEGEFDPWINSLVNQLNSSFDQTGISPTDRQFIPKYKINLIENELVQDKPSFSNNMFLLDSSKKIFSGRITNSTLLTELERKVRSFEISVEEELKYNCGSIASLFLKNDSNTVLKMSTICGVKLTDFVKIELNVQYQETSLNEYPEMLTIEELFSHWLNINGKPNRFFCRMASQFTNDQIHKEKLELFSSKSVVKFD